MLKRLKFSLRTFLFGVVVLTAGVAWWISWPQRKASQLMNAMVSSPEKAESLSGSYSLWTVLQFQHDRPYLEAHSRSASDVVFGRQVFTVVVPTHEKQGNGTLDFTGTLYVTFRELRAPQSLDSRVREADGSTKSKS